MKQKMLLQNFINSLSMAEGASWQMIHQHADPRFIPIRDMLTQLKNNTIAIALSPSDET